MGGSEDSSKHPLPSNPNPGGRGIKTTGGSPPWPWWAERGQVADCWDRTMSKSYNVIAPDPPWWYAENKTGNMPDYPLMKPEELVAMKPLIDGWAANDWCALTMWYTGPKAEEVMDIGRAWGFVYVTMLFVWYKTVMHPGQMRLLAPVDPDGSDCFNVYAGSGRYTKHSTEFCGLWRRGSLPEVADHTVRQEIHAEVREHSRKPPEYRRRIERLWPDVPKLEVFSRESDPGWDVWGNETNKFQGSA